MASLPNVYAPVAGAKYRVCTWHNIYAKTPKTPVGYGLEELLPGKRHYRIVAWHGDYAPWRSKAIANAAVKVINQCAGAEAHHAHK